MYKSAITPLERLEEWFYSAEHGIKGKGWPYGGKLITTFSEMHKLLEDIMGRPVWTSEMGLSNQDALREELKTGDKGSSFYKQMHGFSEAGKLIVVTHDETGEDLSKLKKTLAERENNK